MVEEERGRLGRQCKPRAQRTAGQTHLPAETAQRLLDRGVHLRGGGLDGELDLGAGLTLDRDGELGRAAGDGGHS